MRVIYVNIQLLLKRYWQERFTKLSASLPACLTRRRTKQPGPRPLLIKTPRDRQAACSGWLMRCLVSSDQKMRLNVSSLWVEILVYLLCSNQQTQSDEAEDEQWNVSPAASTQTLDETGNSDLWTLRRAVNWPQWGCRLVDQCNNKKLWGHTHPERHRDKPTNQREVDQVQPSGLDQV